MSTIRINFWAVALASLLHVLITIVWQSPYLFDGLAPLGSDNNPFNVQLLVGVGVTAFFTNLILAWVMVKLAVRSFILGGFFALVLWAGFTATLGLSITMQGTYGTDQVFIMAGKDGIAFLISGMILGSWYRRSDNLFS